MRNLVLKINQYNAAKLVTEAEQIKDAYIEHCQINATHFGKARNCYWRVKNILTGIR